MTTIQGRITNEYGMAIPEVRVLLTKGSSSHHDIAQLSSDDGRYRLHHINAGKLTLLFNATDYDTKQISLFIEKGEHRRLDIILDQN